MNNDGIKTVIQETLDKLGFDLESFSEENLDGNQVFKIKVSEPDRLIGRDGQGFQAFNYLISKMVQKKETDTQRFTIDINDYHQKSVDAIKQKARFAADRARSYKVGIEMDPMNSFERLIVHSMFPEGGDIKTHSVGVGKDRRVVLTYAGD